MAQNQGATGWGRRNQKDRTRPPFGIPTGSRLVSLIRSQRPTPRIRNGVRLLFPDVGHPKKRGYLIALSMTGNKVQAAKAAGVSDATVYSPPWKADEAFLAGLAAAEQCAADIIESEAFRRAVHGVVKSPLAPCSRTSTGQSGMPSF